MTEHRPWFASYPDDVPKTLEPYPEKNLFRLLEELLRLSTACHRGTERSTEPLEQRRLQQEALHGVRLTQQHFLGQVVHQVAMGAAEAD